jgi:hypothetical protein
VQAGKAKEIDESGKQIVKDRWPAKPVSWRLLFLFWRLFFSVPATIPIFVKI